GYLPDFASGELWRFSLRTHRWKRLRADNWPQGKYRRLIHDPSRNLLRTYWDGGGQVYTIPDTGGTWSPEGGAANNDTHYEAYAFMNPLTSQLMLFGGYGFSTFRDDLQAWDGTAWALVGQSAARPEARFGTGTGSVAVDAAGGRAFMGQRHQGIQPGNYDDLWMLRLSDYVWTNLIPATTDSTARLLSAMAYAPHSRRLYRFGGCLPINDPGFCSSYSGETRIANPAAARVRWETLRDGARSPSPRALAGLFFDPVRLRLVLVSGHGADGWQDDVWVRTLP
ncbi:MAG: hypothetical protein JNL26_17960, partial [Gemmatimonadetes bacterium]|nr:hypothetical protein [Gemmatimonadota bacterium]